ncbi:MAG: hypothetical protein KTR31_17170 [Myxococcales bacterium]|nr:hypothetical protein [Myxococcales bacterium]
MDRMIKNTGPPTTTIAAKIPGGLFEGATYTSSSANGVVPVPGTTWAMVLGYGGDFTSTPRLIQLFPVPEGVPIPRQSQLVDAYEEYCNE